jgi:hypothetical protein
MRRLLIGTALLLAACGSKTAFNESNGSGNEAAALNEADRNAAMASETNASQNAPANEAESSNALGTLPPADAALRFVGKWATSKENCASKPWTFTAKALTATDGPSCSFYEVTKVPGGYDVAAQCPHKEPVHTDLIKLRFAESARAMLVESNAIEPTGLIYCGK